MLIRKLALLTLTLLTACSKSTPSADGQPSPAASPREALGRLSGDQAQAFDVWKNSLVKSCDASSPFQAHASDDSLTGVDARALLAANGGSALFTENDSFAILTGYDFFPGQSNSSMTESHELNGSSTVIKAEAHFENGQCKLILNGQPVYQGVIVQSVQLGAYYAPNRAAPAPESSAQINPIGKGPLAEIQSRGLQAALSSVFQPSAEARALVERKLGLSTDAAAKWIQLQPHFGLAIFRLTEPQSPWSRSGALVGPFATFKAALAGGSLPLEARFPLPRLHFADDIQNTADQGNLRLNFRWTITPKGQGTEDSLTQLQEAGITAPNADEAAACVRDRVSSYHQTALKNVRPGINDSFGLCQALSPTLEDDSYKSGLMKALIPQVLQGVQAGPDTQYNGWDNVLTRLVNESLAQNLDLQTELDPDHQSALITQIVDLLPSIKDEIAQTENFSAQPATAYNLALGWIYRGQRVAAARAHLIFQALDNTITAFPVSSVELLGALTREPNSNDAALSFAATVTQAFKDEALKDKQTADAISLREYQSLFNSILQSRLSPAELETWSRRLNALQAAVNAHPNLGSAKSNLVSLANGWLTKGDIQPEEVDSIFAAIAAAQGTFPESTATLLHDLKTSVHANEDALAFARGLTAEYMALAVKIRDQAKQVDFASWGSDFFSTVLQKRPPLSQLQSWNAMWTSAANFSARDKARVGGGYSTPNDWNVKSILETAVKENWTESDFNSLEAIAEVAKYKSACSYRTGDASLADCAGLSLFSKQSGQFLDPAFGGRYLKLAQDFKGFMPRLSRFEFSSVNFRLMNAFFDSKPLWATCGPDVFAQKESSLRDQVNGLSNDRDFSSQFQREQAITTLLEDCN